MFLKRKEFSQDSIYGDILDAIEEKAFCMNMPKESLRELITWD